MSTMRSAETEELVFGLYGFGKLTDGTLSLDRCPHCRVASPLLHCSNRGFYTKDSNQDNERFWRSFVCSKCGGVVVGGGSKDGGIITEVYPKPETLQVGIPPRPAEYLRQAIESIHAPSGAIMLCASSVDAMLKVKGLKDGSLNSRIEEAASTHLITKDMSAWAHEVRLEANDERHADGNASLPNEVDAQRCIDFTKALAMFLFVLPAMVSAGRRKAKRPKALKQQNSPPQAPPSLPSPVSAG